MLTQRIDVSTVADNKKSYHSKSSFSFAKDGNSRGLKLIKTNNTTAQEKKLVTFGEQISFKKISETLKTGESYIEFYGYGDKWYNFLISQQGIKAFRLNSEIVKDVSFFRVLIEEGDVEKLKVVANRLYKELIEPLDLYLTNKNLTIIPHGLLHYLPFNALYDGNKYMVDKFDMRILPSASVLQYIINNKTDSEQLLALGNPDLGYAELSLPFAEVEVNEISNIIKDSDIFVKERATETKVKNSAGKYNMLHFASHGTFNSAIPLDSALLLAKDEQNDGVLTVRELYDMQLNVDLVTLSACETALGHIGNGDDVIGFTRGFLFAGASSIVSSLWQVDDEATYQLMIRFYKNLTTMNKREALAEAQRQLKATYPNPYYWSAFQLSGLAI